MIFATRKGFGKVLMSAALVWVGAAALWAQTGTTSRPIRTGAAPVFPALPHRSHRPRSTQPAAASTRRRPQRPIRPRAPGVDRVLASRVTTAGRHRRRMSRSIWNSKPDQLSLTLRRGTQAPHERMGDAAAACRTRQSRHGASRPGWPAPSIVRAARARRRWRVRRTAPDANAIRSAGTRDRRDGVAAERRR